MRACFLLLGAENAHQGLLVGVDIGLHAERLEAAAAVLQRRGALGQLARGLEQRIVVEVFGVKCRVHGGELDKLLLELREPHVLADGVREARAVWRVRRLRRPCVLWQLCTQTRIGAIMCVSATLLSGCSAKG